MLLIRRSLRDNSSAVLPKPLTYSYRLSEMCPTPRAFDRRPAARAGLGLVDRHPPRNHTDRDQLESVVPGQVASVRIAVSASATRGQAAPIGRAGRGRRDPCGFEV